MTYKSAKRPVCRSCGRPIAKSTFTYYLRAPDPNVTQHGGNLDFAGSKTLDVDAYPATKAEAQRLVPEQIVSVSHGWSASEGKIARFSTWDGESWKDEFFCGGVCAQRYGYRMARMFKREGR